MSNNPNQKEKILLVDDEINVLQGYLRHLRRHYQVHTAVSGPEAFDVIEQKGSFAVVVSDYRMPEMDGIEFLHRVREKIPDTVRILLTGHADTQIAIDAVNRGNIFRFLSKPCSPEDFSLSIGDAADQYRLVMAERELLNKTLKGSVRILIDLLAAVRPVIFSHATRLGHLARKIAHRLRMEKPWEIELAAMLSQIGCVTLPEEVLEKKANGQVMSECEREIYRSHAHTGQYLLSHIPRLQEIAEAIGNQAIRLDRKSSKNHSEIPQISLLSRMLHVVLDYDAQTQTGLDPIQALSRLRESSTWYDPVLLSALEAEVLEADEGYVVESLSLTEIQEGMIFADDVKNKRDILLVPKGTSVSEALKIKLHNFARFGFIAEPVKVLAPVYPPRRPL